MNVMSFFITFVIRSHRLCNYDVLCRGSASAEITANSLSALAFCSCLSSSCKTQSNVIKSTRCPAIAANKSRDLELDSKR